MLQVKAPFSGGEGERSHPNSGKTRGNKYKIIFKEASVVGYQHCPLYGKFMLVESGIREIFSCEIRNCSSRNPESRQRLEPGIQVRLTRNLDSCTWIHSVESRIHDCLGLPCIARVCISYWSSAASVSDTSELIRFSKGKQ